MKQFQLPLDAREGRSRRDAGIAQVLDRDPTWPDRASNMFRKAYVAGETFIGEEVRERLLLLGLDRPHRNAWGGFISGLAKQGLVEDTLTVRPARDPRSHARRMPVWRVR